VRKGYIKGGEFGHSRRSSFRYDTRPLGPSNSPGRCRGSSIRINRSREIAGRGSLA
jgi:hypothetical protein